MVRKVEQDRVRDLLIEAVTVLCQNGLPYESKLRVQGLLGITLDDKDIFLVDIKHEVDKGNMAEIEVSEGTSSENEQQEGSLSSPRRRKRRRRRSGNRPDGDRADSEEPQIKRPSSDSQDGFEIKQEIKEEIDDTGEPEPGCSAWPGIAGEESSPLAMGQPIPAPQQVPDHQMLDASIPNLNLNVGHLQPFGANLNVAYGQQQRWPFPERPKPPCSLTDLIALGITSSPNKQASVNEIIEFVHNWFPYYQRDKKWHQSLKSALYGSTGTQFLKLPRKPTVPYNEYTLVPDFGPVFRQKLPSLKMTLKSHIDPNFQWQANFAA